jgi:hypothetical protein
MSYFDKFVDVEHLFFCDGMVLLTNTYMCRECKAFKNCFDSRKDKL